MCAAIAEKIVKESNELPINLSPTSLLRIKINALFLEQQAAIKHTAEQHAQFKQEWHIDEREIFFRGNNSQVTYAKKTRESNEEKGKGPSFENGYIAKIFCAQNYIMQNGDVLSDNQDVRGMYELSLLTHFYQEKVPHVPFVIAASWDYENRKTILILPNLGDTIAHEMRFSKAPLPINEITAMTISMLNCLSYITESMGPHIKHADLKLTNILKQGNNFTLIDWGGMVRGRVCALESLMSLDIRPPEVILRFDAYGPEVDIWSLGITLLMAATNEIIADFDGDEDEIRLLHAICSLTSCTIPIDMQQRSRVKKQFFDENGNLLGRYLPRKSCAGSLYLAQFKLIQKLPKGHADREKLATYYDRLAKFIPSLLIIDPVKRPNNHRLVLEHFSAMGLN